MNFDLGRLPDPKCLTFLRRNKLSGDGWFWMENWFLEKKDNNGVFLCAACKQKNAKMENSIFTPFGQKRKTLYKRNVLGTLFRPESQKRDFSTFGNTKVEMSSFFASGALAAPKTLQNGKVGPKLKKRFGTFWAPKTCPEPYVFTVLRSERK